MEETVNRDTLIDNLQELALRVEKAANHADPKHKEVVLKNVDIPQARAFARALRAASLVIQEEKDQ